MGFFAIPMARLVGPDGRVIAADVEPKLLEKLMRRAERAGMDGRIVPCLADTDDLQLSSLADQVVDFALCFYTLHELPAPDAALTQIRDALRPGGLFLLAEPWLHVSRKHFDWLIGLAEEAGLRRIREERAPLSRALLFERA
jgi:ubiquinone/menaquinone biosynthesis C-methylase UbiE